jgi:acyl-CoA synthetase (AMP-forming)/AMP-acid ligase II
VLTVDAFNGADHIGTALQSGATLAAEGIALRVLSLRSAASGDTLPEGAIAFTAAPADDPRRATLSSRCAALGVDADDIATICWTSGTEGTPKGVPRSHNHWRAISWAHLRGASIQPGETLLNPFPLVNMAALGGCFMSWLHTGGTLLLHHPLDLPTFFRQIATERPQYAIAPPAVLNMLLKNGRVKLCDFGCASTLRAVGTDGGGADSEGRPSTGTRNCGPCAKRTRSMFSGVVVSSPQGKGGSAQTGPSTSG